MVSLFLEWEERIDSGIETFDCAMLTVRRLRTCREKKGWGLCGCGAKEGGRERMESGSVDRRVRVRMASNQLRSEV